MGTFSAIFASVAILAMMWFMWRFIKANPESLSKKALSQSFTTMGVLALILIGAIALVIKML